MNNEEVEQRIKQAIIEERARAKKEFRETVVYPIVIIFVMLSPVLVPALVTLLKRLFALN